MTLTEILTNLMLIVSLICSNKNLSKNHLENSDIMLNSDIMINCINGYHCLNESSYIRCHIVIDILIVRLITCDMIACILIAYIMFTCVMIACIMLVFIMVQYIFCYSWYRGVNDMNCKVSLYMISLSMS